MFLRQMCSELSQGCQLSQVFLMLARVIRSNNLLFNRRMQVKRKDREKEILAISACFDDL